MHGWWPNKGDLVASSRATEVRVINHEATIKVGGLVTSWSLLDGWSSGRRLLVSL